MGKYFNRISIQYGFTLIELLIVVFLMSILTLSSITVFFSYTRSQSFQIGVADVVNILNKAKSRSISQTKPMQECGTERLEGYEFSHPSEGTYYILSVKCGGIYHILERKNLPAQVSFTPDSTNKIFFNASTGIVSSAGQIILVSNGATKIVNIDTVGNISVE